MRNRWIAGFAVLLLCISLPSPAADYYHLRDDVTNDYGTAIPGASVYVRTPNTETTVTAYTDLAGGTGVSWPLTTDSNGYFECYVADGTYDIRIVHAGHNIATTWDNYMVGTGSDSLGFVSADSIRIDGDGTNADLRFGVAGVAGVTGRLFIPSNTLWLRRSGGTVRRQDSAYDYCFGVGASSVQFEERSSIDWAFGDADHATGGYDDRAVLYLDETNADSTATDADAYQAVILANTRADSSQWMMGGVKGVTGFWQGTPDYGIRLQTDIPDSSGTGGERDAVQIRWWLSDSKGRIYDDDSTFLNLLEHDTSHYKFAQTQLRLYSQHEDEKRLSIKGARADTTATAWTHLMNDHLQTELRCNTATLAVLDYDGSDDATLNVFKAVVDTINFAILSATYEGNLPTASGHTSQIWFNTALDSCWISTGSAWLQLSQ